MKRLIKVSMLLMMATLLAACNNEEITQQDKEKKIDAPKGGVVFATNDTKISAKRWFIDDKAFTDAKTSLPVQRHARTSSTRPAKVPTSIGRATTSFG